ncbi:17430_t:CDS:1, partial [Dentiscutata erythropus]
FLANKIEISYADNSAHQFCFQKLGSSEDLDFASKLSSEIDKLLEVSSDPHKDDKIFKVKYEELHMFSMSEDIII